MSVRRPAVRARCRSGLATRASASTPDGYSLVPVERPNTTVPPRQVRPDPSPGGFGEEPPAPLERVPVRASRFVESCRAWPAPFISALAGPHPRVSSRSGGGNRPLIAASPPSIGRWPLRSGRSHRSPPNSRTHRGRQPPSKPVPSRPSGRSMSSGGRFGAGGRARATCSAQVLTCGCLLQRTTGDEGDHRG